MRDAQGNVLAVYEEKPDDGTLEYELQERNIYGSSRVGMLTTEVEMIGATQGTINYTHIIGNRQYELSNHLGNVLAVITDKKIPRDDNKDAIIDYYQPEVLTSMDYSPFRVLLEDRNWESKKYRFGWQSQEHTDEISGTGNHYIAGFWEYYPRVVTRWNNDPVVKPWQSPYVILCNNPIWRIDPNGDDDYKVDKKGNISLVKETDAKQDVLFATDKKGNILEDKSFTADKGVFNNSRTNTVEGSNGKSYTFDQYDVQDDDKS